MPGLGLGLCTNPVYLQSCLPGEDVMTKSIVLLRCIVLQTIYCRRSGSTATELDGPSSNQSLRTIQSQQAVKEDMRSEVELGCDFGYPWNARLLCHRCNLPTSSIACLRRRTSMELQSTPTYVIHGSKRPGVPQSCTN